MFDFLWGFVTDVLKVIAVWVVDLFLWFWELVYSMWNEFSAWLMDVVLGWLLRAFDAVEGYIPGDVVDVIAASFEWLEYIDSWVPVKYGTSLLTAYYGVWLTLLIYRKLRGLVWGFGG